MLIQFSDQQFGNYFQSQVKFPSSVFAKNYVGDNKEKLRILVLVFILLELALKIPENFLWLQNFNFCF